MGKSKKITESRRKYKEIYDPLPFSCIMCGKYYRTSEELAEHQYYNCTGGWTK